MGSVQGPWFVSSPWKFHGLGSKLERTRPGQESCMVQRMHLAARWGMGKVLAHAPPWPRGEAALQPLRDTGVGFQAT